MHRRGLLDDVEAIYGRLTEHEIADMPPRDILAAHSLTKSTLEGNTMLALIQQELQQFLNEDDGKPIVILNLLRFAPDGGRERWSAYTAAAGPILGRYGAEMVYVGDTLPALSAEAGQSWDSVALIRYPNRQAYANLANDPDYHEKAEPLREAALQEAVVQPIRTVG